MAGKKEEKPIAARSGLRGLISLLLTVLICLLGFSGVSGHFPSFLGGGVAPGWLALVALTFVVFWLVASVRD